MWQLVLQWSVPALHCGSCPLVVSQWLWQTLAPAAEALIQHTSCHNKLLPVLTSVLKCTSHSCWLYMSSHCVIMGWIKTYQFLQTRTGRNVWASGTCRLSSLSNQLKCLFRAWQHHHYTLTCIGCKCSMECAVLCEVISCGGMWYAVVWWFGTLRCLTVSLIIL